MRVFLFTLCSLFCTPDLYAHGLTTSTASVQLQQNHVVNLQIQFDYIELLNHQKHKYSLPVVASLSEIQFSQLYAATTALFKKHLTVEKQGKPLTLNFRYPSAQQVHALLKAQLAQTQFTKHSKKSLYTFNDRRFYQTFNADFRLASAAQMNEIAINFPKPLGDIYITYSEPKTAKLKQGTHWRK